VAIFDRLGSHLTHQAELKKANGSNTSGRRRISSETSFHYHFTTQFMVKISSPKLMNVVDLHGR
jgi:hypothetical protein